MKDFLQTFFKLKENKTNIRTEVLAGLTTFITMAYVVLVIPNILKFSGMNLEGIKGDKAALLTALNDPVIGSVFTALCVGAGIGTIIMGVYANLPFALAPGMGLCAFFTYSVCLNLGYSWKQALAAVFVSGILFIIITITSIREKIVDALPENLKIAIAGGIGLFVALIGLKSGSIIVANSGTLISFGKFTNTHAILTIIGLVITVALMAKKIRGSILIAIILTTIIGIPMGITDVSNIHVLKMPPSMMPTLFAFDFKGLLGAGGAGLIGAFTSIVMVIITFSLVDLFDTIGTLVGTAEKANMIDENGKVKNMKKALLADAVATTMSASIGTPTMATYVESTAGIAEGGRTGLTSCIVGIMFLLSLFFSGLVGIVPSEATAPALIVVGSLMMSSITKLNFDDFTEAFPAFLTIAIMPFSYSVANGIAAGVIFYPIVKLATGKRKEVHPIVYVLAILFVVRFVLLPD